MIDMLKRHEIQVLRRAGHSLDEVAKLAGVSRRSVVRVVGEMAVTQIDNEAERGLRRIGRPSKAEPFRAFVVEQVTKAGIKLTAEKKMGADYNYQAWIEDPDGNRIELMQVVPKAMQLDAIARLKAGGTQVPVYDV